MKDSQDSRYSNAKIRTGFERFEKGRTTRNALSHEYDIEYNTIKVVNLFLNPAYKFKNFDKLGKDAGVTNANKLLKNYARNRINKVSEEVIKKYIALLGEKSPDWMAKKHLILFGDESPDWMIKKHLTIFGDSPPDWMTKKYEEIIAWEKDQKESIIGLLRNASKKTNINPHQKESLRVAELLIQTDDSFETIVNRRKNQGLRPALKGVRNVAQNIVPEARAFLRKKLPSYPPVKKKVKIIN